MANANAALLKADAKAIGVSQAAGVMLAIGSTRPGLGPAVVVWGAAMVVALVALFPVLRGDHGIVAWSRGRDGSQDEVRELARLAIFKFRCVQVAIVLLVVSPVALLF